MFERFDPPARRVIERAWQFASRLGWSFIHPYHLLWSLSDADAGIAGGVLQDVGATPGNVEAEIEKLVKGGGSPTEDARWFPSPDWFGADCMRAAIAEADRLGDAEVTPLHILLALTRSEIGFSVTQLLERLGTSANEVRRKLAETAGNPAIDEPYQLPKVCGWNYACASARTAGEDIAFDARRYVMDSGDLLLGLTVLEEGIAFRAIQALGISRQQLTEAVNRERQRDPDDGFPSREVATS